MKTDQIPPNFEIIRHTPFMILRKIQDNKLDNESKNEYHWYYDGELSDESFNNPEQAHNSISAIAKDKTK